MFQRLFGKGNVQLNTLGREFAVGDVVEQRFDIEQVRRGYMGIVYIAHDRHRRRKVVLKTFQNKFLWDDAAIARFNAEAELWMRLGSHPNIVRAYDLRTFLGKPHVVAEYVHGGPLRALIGHLSLQEALDYAIQICWGMDYASERTGLLHCDIKPDNIMVTLDGHAKVTDFGLARVMPIWQLSDEQRANQEMLRVRGTTVETLGGTLPYMAPELLDRSSIIGSWSDIYAFGVSLYELVTGKLPFDADRDESLIRMHLYQPVPDPRSLRPHLPPVISDIVLTCMAKRPEERYQTFAEAAQALQQLRSQQFGAPLHGEWEGRGAAARDQWTERGQAHMDLGEYKDALQCFRHAVELDGEQSAGWMNLARARLRLWQYGEAQQAVEEALKYATSRNEIGPLYQVRGEIYSAMQRPAEAVAAYDQGLSFTPNSPGLWREKGALLLRLGMLREARDCLTQAVRLDAFDPVAQRLLGDALLAKGNLRAAHQAYGEALQLDPRSALGWARYGTCQLKQSRPQEALRSFEAAIRLDPDQQEALDGLRLARQSLSR